MADVFSNSLRVREQESGSNAGTWGGLLNTTIRNIASAFGQGSETIPNASTHTITLADGVADEARSMYLKCTGGGQACTVTLAPNTISKVWIISNETSFTLTFSQGSGANVAIAAGAVKMIVTDGAGASGAVTDALSGLEGVFGTVTGANATFTTADNSDNLTLTSTDADASFGPNIRMYRNSGSPADNDLLGNIEFEGRNDNSQDVVYGRLFSRIVDASDGTEDGRIRFDIMKAGSLSDVLTINPDEIIVNDGSYDYDFRVESNDNTHALFVQGSDGSVGIGTSSPGDFFSTANNLVVGSGSGSEGITVYSGNDSIGNLFFADGTSGTAEYSGYLEYSHANDSLRIGTGGSERLRVTSTGAVGIGTSSITSLGTGITTLELKGNSASQTDRTGGIRFTRYDGTHGMSIYNADGASYIESRSTYPLLITTNGTEAIRISDSNLLMSGAIQGGQLSHVVVNTLSDDSVYVLDPPNNIGIVMFAGRNDNYDYIHGIVSYRTSANTYATQMGAGNSNVLIGEFSGVPGVSNVSNGFFSVVVSDNGNIYFWNRLGVAVSVSITLFGA